MSLERWVTRVMQGLCAMGGALRTSNVRSCVFAKRKKPLRTPHNPASLYKRKKYIKKKNLTNNLKTKFYNSPSPYNIKRDRY